MTTSEFSDLTLDLQALIFADFEPPMILGIQIAASAPSIMTTINNSTNVNAFLST